MKLFVIIATVVACTCAASTVELLHPSPVNPDVLVAVKPEEKVILITDPQEIEKFKRETKQPLYPTVLPREHGHHITKRDHKTSHQKRDIPVPLVAKHYHPEESTKAKEENFEYRTIKDRTQEHVTTESFQKPQTLPLILNDTGPGTHQHKRDIPVPLVPKHRHSEQSLVKDNNKKESFQNHKKVSTESLHEAQTTGHEQEHSFKIEQQKPQVLLEISEETKHFKQHRKRETSISLVSKAESSDEVEQHKENKEVESGNYHVSQIHPVSQSLPSDNYKQISTDGFNKPQIHQEPLNQNNNHYPNAQPYPDHNRKHLPVERFQAHYKANIIPTQKSQSITTHQDNHHTEGTKAESNDENKEVNNIANDQSSLYTHREDLSESTPSPILIKHALPMQEDHKRNIQDDHLSVRDITTSAIEHPLLRHRPVPVAELFASESFE